MNATDRTDASSSVLGRGMAHRARPQTVLAQRWSSAGVVGAVGRASVGFGLAVGRSRAIRPTVCVDDLNSAALRPSLHAWRQDDDTETTTAVAESGAPDPSDTARQRSSVGAGHRATQPTAPPSPSPTVRRLASSNGAPRRPPAPRVPLARAATRRARHQREAPRPTWTDQVIQRSAIGYSAPPLSSARAADIPDDFVPSGDSKVDQLRLLLRQRDAVGSGGAPSRDERTPPRRTEQPNPVTDIGDRMTAAGGRRGDTAAGSSTGPGRFARSLRPEPVGDGSPAAPRGSGTSSSPGVSLPMMPAASPSGSPAIRRAPAARRAVPDKMEALRAALVERGLFTPSDGDAPVPTDTAADRGGHDAPGRRGAPTRNADVRSSGTGDTTRGSVQTPGESAGPDAARRSDTSSTIRRAARRPGPTIPSTAANTPPAVRPSSPSGTADGPAPGGAGQATAGADRGLQPSTARLAPSADTPFSTDDRSVRSPIAGTQQGLRAQRLLSTGLAPIARGLAELDGPADAGAPAASTMRSDGTTLVRERAAEQVVARSIDDVVARSTDGDAASAPSQRSVVTGVGTDVGQYRAAAVDDRRPVDMVARRISQRPQPTLPAPLNVTSATSTDQVLRRVTLPRALSATHRPPSAVVARDRMATGPIGVAARTASPNATIAVESQSTSSASASAARVTPDMSPTPAWPLESMTGAAGEPRSAAITATGLPSASTIEATTATTARRRADSVRTAATPPHAAGANPHVQARTSALRDVVRRVAAEPRPAPALPSVLGATVPVRPIAEDVTAPTDAASASVQRAVTTTSVRPDQATEAGPVQAPAERVAEQFMTELSKTTRNRPTPLPASFRPLADAIAGPRPVMLSTDSASRRALRSVGKVAATTGDTIHLDRPSVSASQLNEVMAHELTHIAAPSPAPRFFDDIDDSPEERRAERVGRLMASSPLAPTSSVVAPAGRAPVIRRSPKPTTTAPDSTPTTSAASLVAQITGGNSSRSSAGSSDVIRRWNSATPSGRAPVIGGHRGAAAPADPNPAPKPDPEPSPAPASSYSLAGDDSAPEWFEEQLQAHLQPLLRMIEDRMIVELERRGGRTWRMS
ncbi:MAG: DUF4157 domain-containing protein [Ilumatobacteraceae bacterium]